MTAPLPLRLLNALTPARVWPRETRERAEYAF
jgi:hypothetical protein